MKQLLDGNNFSILPTLDGWVYIDPIHGPLDGPLYTWAQYTPTLRKVISLLHYQPHIFWFMEIIFPPNLSKIHQYLD